MDCLRAIRASPSSRQPRQCIATRPYPLSPASITKAVIGWAPSPCTPPAEQGYADAIHAGGQLGRAFRVCRFTGDRRAAAHRRSTRRSADLSCLDRRPYLRTAQSHVQGGRDQQLSAAHRVGADRRLRAGFLRPVDSGGASRRRDRGVRDRMAVAQQSELRAGHRAQSAHAAEPRGLATAGVLSHDHAAHGGPRIDFGRHHPGRKPAPGIPCLACRGGSARSRRADRVAHRVSMLPLCRADPEEAGENRYGRRSAPVRLYSVVHRRADLLEWRSRVGGDRVSWGVARPARLVTPDKNSPNKSTTVGPSKPRLWDTLGPGLITGAADDDPSGIATYSQAGSQFGYQLAWTLLLTYPLMVVIQAICARIGRTTGLGIAGNLRAHYPKRLVQGIVGLLFVANTLNIGADLGAMGDSMHLLVHIAPAWAYVALFGVVCTAAQILFQHRRYVSILKWLTLSLLAYFGAVMVVHVQWIDLAKGLVLPRLTGTSGFWLMVVAIFGTTI